MRLWFRAAAAAVGLGVLLSGCQSSVPQAENFPNQRQFIVMSMAQWQILANWTVTQLGPSLPANRRVNVHASSVTPFSRAYAQFLATALVHHGYVVGPGDGVATVHFSVQVVDHGYFAAAPLTFSLAGTLAGASTWVAFNNATKVVPLGAPPIGLAIGAMADAHRMFLPQPTDSEIVVTTSLGNGEQRYAGRSDVFYISGADRSEYESGGDADADLLVSQANH